METEVKDKSKSVISNFDLKRLTGIWELTYTPKNSQGVSAFGGYLLSAYQHPVSLLPCPLKTIDGKIQAGIMINNTLMRFEPDKNANVRLQIDWLLSHPEVALESYDGLHPAIVQAKNKSTKIKLICLDNQLLESLDEEDYIDKLIGLISLDGGPNALSLDRLRHVLALLGLSYQDMRYVTNKAVEKKSLRSRLKTFAKKSLQNAKSVELAIEEKENGKYNYEIKEMMRFQIIKINNGMYLYQGIPVSAHYEGVVSWFNANPQHYLEAQAELFKLLR